MVYIASDGSVQKKRSFLRLSIISDLFWGVLNVVHLFVMTLLSPKKTIPRRSSSETRGTNGVSGRQGGFSIRQLDTSCTAPGG